MDNLVDGLDKVLDTFSKKGEENVLVNRTSTEDLEKISAWYDQAFSEEDDTKKNGAQLEQTSKKIIHKSTEDDDDEGSNNKICHLLDSILYLASQAKCDYPLTHLLIEELVDIQTVEWCQKFWPFMISREGEISNNLAGNKAPGTTLIRLCNSVLRRLSKTRDAQFSGQIAMYLARAFPISEKSGLNIRGSFNTENITTYEEERNDNEIDQETHDLYVKFWSIQSAFADPTSIFSPEKMSEFEQKITDVMEVIKSKAKEQDASKRSQKKGKKRPFNDEESNTNDKSAEEEDDIFVPKWLTRKELFELQLKDPSFRRTILTQILIISNFLLSLTSEEKAKWNSKYKAVNRGVMYSYTLPKDDKQFFEKIMKNLHASSAIHDLYAKFVDTLLEIFKREQDWQIWKLQSCPSFESPATSNEKYIQAEEGIEKHKQPRKKYWHAMGTPGLTKVWKIKTGLDDLSDKQKYEIPSAESYHDRVKELNEEKERIKNAEDMSESEKKTETESIQANIDSTTWRGLRAARDQGYWVQFGYVDKLKGFSGLFMTADERAEYDKQKRPPVSNNPQQQAAPPPPPLSANETNGTDEEPETKRVKLDGEGQEESEEQEQGNDTPDEEMGDVEVAAEGQENENDDEPIYESDKGPPENQNDEPMNEFDNGNNETPEVENVQVEEEVVSSNDDN